MENQIETELTIAIQNQMKAKDEVNKALNNFFEASRIRLEKEVIANMTGTRQKSCCKSKKDNCDNGGCGCS